MPFQIKQIPLLLCICITKCNEKHVYNPTWNAINNEILGKLGEQEFEKQFILSVGENRMSLKDHRFIG